jgi:hypothetical protein
VIGRNVIVEIEGIEQAVLAAALLPHHGDVPLIDGLISQTMKGGSRSREFFNRIGRKRTLDFAGSPFAMDSHRECDDSLSTSRFSSSRRVRCAMAAPHLEMPI